MTERNLLAAAKHSRAVSPALPRSFVFYTRHTLDPEVSCRGLAPAQIDDNNITPTI